MGKCIYILLTDTGTIFSRLIKCYTRAPYNHSSIALDRQFNQLFSFGRRSYMNPFSAGFIRERVDRGVFKHKRNTRCAVYCLQVSDSQYKEIRKMILQFEEDPLKYKYNLLGCIGIIFGIKFQRAHAFTCSQFVSTILTKSGIHTFDKCCEMIRPDDIASIPQLSLVYEGHLHHYWESSQVADPLYKRAAVWPNLT
ncbi:hypothetical protein ACQCVH_20160 [Bacillus infantis]|uniref:hypothetical protein n=1 Tax=Bacillus infantis TaxID=324767 RepID=UPI003CF747FD